MVLCGRRCRYGDAWGGSPHARTRRPMEQAPSPSPRRAAPYRARRSRRRHQRRHHRDTRGALVHHHRRYSSWRSVHLFKRLCNVSFCFCFPRRWRRRSTTLLVQALRLLCAAPQLRTHDATPTDCDLSTAPGASTCCRCRRAPRTLDVQCSGAARGGTDEALDGGAPRARGVNLRAMLRARCTAMPSSRHRDVWSRRFSISMPTAGAAVGGRPSSGARRAPAAARRGDSAKSSACDASRWVPHALGGANAALPRRGSYCVGAFSSSASRESSRDRRDVHAARALRFGQ